MSYYEAYVDGLPLHVPGKKETMVINPKVVLDIKEAGSFDFILPPNHLLFNSIVPMGSTVKVYEDGECIFYGRPLPPKRDMYGRKTYHCEGAAAFLNDCILTPYSQYEGQSLTDAQYYSAIIDEYNTYVGSTFGASVSDGSRQINIGTTPAAGGEATQRSFSGCPTAFDEIKRNILPYTGGWLVERPVNGETGITLDYISDFDTSAATNTQPIALRVNILDLLQTGQEFYTAIVATGADGIALYTPMTLSDSIMQTYGFICAYKKWPECTTLAALKAKCTEFLNAQQFSAVSLELSAADLHLVNPAYDRIKLCDICQIVAPETGLADGLLLPVTRLEIPLDSGRKKVALGTATRTTMTRQNWQTNANAGDIAWSVNQTVLPNMASNTAYDINGNLYLMGYDLTDPLNPLLTATPLIDHIVISPATYRIYEAGDTCMNCYVRAVYGDGTEETLELGTYDVEIPAGTVLEDGVHVQTASYTAHGKTYNASVRLFASERSYYINDDNSTQIIPLFTYEDGSAKGTGWKDDVLVPHTDLIGSGRGMKVVPLWAGSKIKWCVMLWESTSGVVWAKVVILSPIALYVYDKIDGEWTLTFGGEHDPFPDPPTISSITIDGVKYYYTVFYASSPSLEPQTAYIIASLPTMSTEEAVRFLLGKEEEE